MLSTIRCVSMTSNNGQNTWCVNKSALLFWMLFLIILQQNSCTLALSFVVLPDSPHFRQLCETCRPRNAALSRTQTELILPTIPDHTDPELTRADISRAGTHKGLGILCHNALDLDSSGPSDNIDPGDDIKRLLDILHSRYPALEYPQYENRLRSLGICYLAVAAMFNADFYIGKVGMATGAAHLFCKWIAESQRVYQGGWNGKGEKAEAVAHKGQKENIAL